LRDAVPFIMMVNHVAVRIPLEALVMTNTINGNHFLNSTT